MVSLSQINKKYEKYLETPIIKEWNDDEPYYLVVLKRPYVWDGNNSMFSESDLNAIVTDFKTVKENPEWWNKEYGEN